MNESKIRELHAKCVKLGRSVPSNFREVYRFFLSPAIERRSREQTNVKRKPPEFQPSTRLGIEPRTSWLATSEILQTMPTSHTQIFLNNIQLKGVMMVKFFTCIIKCCPGWVYQTTRYCFTCNLEQLLRIKVGPGRMQVLHLKL